MTKEEFMFDHNLELVIDLIQRDIEYMNPPEEETQKDNELPVMAAGDFL